VESNEFYVRAEAGDGFTPFTYDASLPDNWYGMTMEFSFAQTDKNTVFELSSSDDAWVFIDGCLVLDLGGGNATKKGTIDFATGTVTATAGTATQSHTILQRYQAAGRQPVTTWNGNTYAEGTTHTLQVFFLDRTTRG
jgi:fibro-slime domain-containing protein